MVRDALAADQLIGMIQPRGRRRAAAACSRSAASAGSPAPRSWTTAASTSSSKASAGSGSPARPRSTRSTARSTPSAAASTISAEPEPLGLAQRAELEREARRYADALGYSVDWDAVTRLDDEMLVNAIAQVAPLDVGSKQALLEAPDIAERCDLLVQFMQFQRMVPGGADGPETLQ